MPQKKYYVVWKWKKAWVYETWDECKKQVDGFKDAVYKSFSAKDIALKAYAQWPEDYIGKEAKQETSLTPEQKKKFGAPLEKSICVDAAWNTATGDMEYRWIDFQTKKELFHIWPLPDGTNNIWEFLAIVHALSYCQKKWIATPIYSDSRNALLWVQKKDVKTKLEKTEKNKEIFDLILRALIWLEKNTYTNPLLKWETKAWGENPADFGRK